MEGNLDTTNLLLGIMAAVSVLQAVVLVGLGVFGFRLYRQTLQAIQDIEQRHVVPLAAQVSLLISRVDAVVGDVKEVTSRLTRQTERVDSAIDHTIHRVDETAGRVRDSIGVRMYQLMGLVHGITTAVQGLFTGRRRSSEAPAT